MRLLGERQKDPSDLQKLFRSDPQRQLVDKEMVTWRRVDVSMVDISALISFQCFNTVIFRIIAQRNSWKEGQYIKFKIVCNTGQWN